MGILLRQCMCCGVHYMSERKFTCSVECNEQLQKEFYQEKLDELELTLAQLKDRYEEGGISKEYFQSKWNWELYEARNIRDLREEDIQIVTDKLKDESNVNVK